jgi:hypothetical protein
MTHNGGSTFEDTVESQSTRKRIADRPRGRWDDYGDLSQPSSILIDVKQINYR